MVEPMATTSTTMILRLDVGNPRHRLSHSVYYHRGVANVTLAVLVDLGALVIKEGGCAISDHSFPRVAG